MSALPPKADMLSVGIDVCFVPRTDIPRCFESWARRAALIRRLICGPLVLFLDHLELLALFLSFNFVGGLLRHFLKE